MEDTPELGSTSGAVLGGATRDASGLVRDFNLSTGTVWPTLRGLPPDAAVHLAAHGYAMVAASLAAQGVDLDRFSVPHERVSSVV